MREADRENYNGQSDQPSSTEILGSPQRSRRRESLLYAIIAALTIIIVIGGVYSLSAERGHESVKVELFSPTNEVQLTTNITILFSKDLVSDSLVNVRLDAAPLEFQPGIAGKFEWIARNKLRFYPDAPLAPSTRYTAEVLPKIAAGYGYVFKGDRKFSFYTPQFRVNSAWLTYELVGESTGLTNLYSTIGFNYEVDPLEAAKYISVRYDDGSVIPYKLGTEAPSEVISLLVEGVERGEKEKQIQVRIAKGLNCIGGAVGLLDDFTSPLSLPGREELKVESALPEQESIKSRMIRVQFNLPINSQNAVPFIALEPKLEFKLTSTHNYIDIHAEFDPTVAYQLFIRKGLRAVDGSTLPRDFSSTLTLAQQNIPPQVGFVGDGCYLTRSGNLNVGVATINIDKVSIEVDKVFANNLTHLLNNQDVASEGRNYYYYDEEYGYRGRSDLAAIGQNIHREDIVVAGHPNEEVVTPINIKEYLADNRVGIFRVTARNAGERWTNATRWVVATDLGILTKKAKDDLWVWVNSLTTLKPIDGADLKLLSRNNQTLATARTNGDGIAIFKNYEAAGKDFTPYLITASLGSDLSFVELERRMIPTSDFEVDGAPYLSGGLEAFLYTERGVYRPGEMAHLAAIVRGANQTIPPAFPLRIKITGPDGKIVTEEKATLNEQGATELSVTIPDYLLTGKYLATMLIGENEEIGRTTFNVEEFVPDRMKVKLTTDKSAYLAGNQINIDVEAVTLFGPPAAGRRVQSEVELSPVTFTTPKWKSFTFEDPVKSFARQTHQLADTVLDDNGRITYKYNLANDLTAPSALRGFITATALETGGRGVTAYSTVMIHPCSTYVGLRQAQEGYGKPDTEMPIEFVAVSPEGEPVPGRNIEVTLLRIYWQSILKFNQRRGGYRYVSEEVEDIVTKFNVTSANGVGSLKVTPNNYGRFRVVARDTQSGASASIWFYASGWGYAPWAMDHPDRIEIDLDKESYKPGETAQIQVRAPFSGKLLLTIEREKVFEYKVVTLKENTATIKMPITDQYRPNVFVSAHLIRSTEKLERDTKVRAFGVVPLKVSTESNRLAIDLQTPTEIRPNSKLTINFKVSGQARSTPYLTIAAVDEGICQLTDFTTPDPHGFFFGKKRLSVESYDIYSSLLPEIAATSSSPSGDLGASKRRRLTPITVARIKPVAFWSGLIKTDEQGNGSIGFDMPQFSGSVRVMAVAFANDKFGNAQKNVFVREPIVLTPTFPRFIGSTDQLVIPVNVYNGAGADADFEVNLSATGPVSIIGMSTENVRVPMGKESPVYFTVKGDQSMGKIEFRLAAKGGGSQTSMKEEVPLRPPVPFITLTGNGSVTAAVPATFKFPADWIAGTTDFTLSVSPFPAVKFSSSLQYLLTYPHGCIEQTTSRVFPLLYFSELARLAEPDLFKKNSSDYFVEEGITKLENMQLASGVFSYWPQGGYQNDWSSIYVTHFLVEARKAGFTISDRVYDKALGALQSFARDYRTDRDDEYVVATYAGYVLALAGKPDKSSLAYLKNNALSHLQDYSRCQLAGALALAGDLPTARTLLPKTILVGDTLKRWESGGNFNSSIRARAIMLEILAEVDPTSPLAPKLVESLTKDINPQGRWHTTQENAYALMALGKVMKKQGKSDYTGVIKVNGTELAQIDNQNHNFAAKDWGGKEATITITGEGTCYYYWRVDGLPSTLKIDEYDNDLQVRRRYLDENGNPADYQNFRQGDMVVAEITVKALHESLDNVAIVDMLPAGFEIENPRLQSRKGITWIGDRAYQPLYMDIRDDRMVVFGNFAENREEIFYYGIRVVSEGSFIVPPIRAEAMYAPMKASVSSSGKIVVTKP
jgi:hypothetical protein